MVIIADYAFKVKSTRGELPDIIIKHAQGFYNNSGFYFCFSINFEVWDETFEPGFGSDLTSRA